MATSFISLSNLPLNLYCDEDLKPNFEDAKFINEYLLENLESNSAFLQKARYFYRKRADKSSTLDKQADAQTQISKMSHLLNLLLLAREKLGGKVPDFIQKTIIYDLSWVIRPAINQSSAFSLQSLEQRDELLRLFDEIFALIEPHNILSFNFARMQFHHKAGILNCFKNTYPPYQIAYIDELDSAKDEILIRYFTPDAKDTQRFLLDGKEQQPSYEKIVQYDFLNRVFIYEKRFWLQIPQSTVKPARLEIYIHGKKASIRFKRKKSLYLSTQALQSEFKELSKLKSSGLWILMDRDVNADDNAEHLYRYIAKNHPERDIVFALRKSSPDFKRLKNEGFKLVEYESLAFKRLAKRASKIISSHADYYILRYFKHKDFVFLQHGITKDDISLWLNPKPISLFITATKREFHSIKDDFTPYKFGSKEVKLTGFARHDALLRANKQDSRQILIMPTWRKNILDEPLHGFTNLRSAGAKFMKSEYFLKWQSLLKSKALKELCQRYNYQVIFNPHPNIKPHLSLFSLPDFIKVYKEGECSLQRLFGESALMITDYSSVAFEMAYLGKCVLYYQFDEQEFFAAHGQWQRGYFSYRKDGFGPVCVDEASLLNELENLLKNECKPSGIYKENIENTFEFKDGKCCERIFEMVLNLDKKE